MSANLGDTLYLATECYAEKKSNKESIAFASHISNTLKLMLDKAVEEEKSSIYISTAWKYLEECFSRKVYTKNYLEQLNFGSEEYKSQMEKFKYLRAFYEWQKNALYFGSIKETEKFSTSLSYLISSYFKFCAHKPQEDTQESTENWWKVKKSFEKRILEYGEEALNNQVYNEDGFAFKSSESKFQVDKILSDFKTIDRLNISSEMKEILIQLNQYKLAHYEIQKDYYNLSNAFAKSGSKNPVEFYQQYQHNLINQESVDSNDGM